LPKPIQKSKHPLGRVLIYNGFEKDDHVVGDGDYNKWHDQLTGASSPQPSNRYPYEAVNDNDYMPWNIYSRLRKKKFLHCFFLLIPPMFAWFSLSLK